MKVVREITPSDKITIDNIHSLMFIVGKPKGLPPYIVSRNIPETQYRVRVFTSLFTDGDQYSQYNALYLKDVIRNLINAEHEVHAFIEAKDAFKWLAENSK